MPLRLSKALRNFTNEHGSVKQALNNGKLRLFTGSQPASGDAAETGTLLCEYTLDMGAHTEEVYASGTVTLNSGASGSVDTLTVNSLEIMGSATNFNTSLAQTATDVATKINNNPKNLLFVASASGAVITIKAKPGLGTLANGWVVASTVTTITKTDVNLSGGVMAVNGLTFGDSANGVLSKNPAEVWKGLGLSDGNAGYFRFVAAVDDPGALDSSEIYMRLDGSVSTSGGNMNMASVTITTDAENTLSTCVLTEPAEGA